MDSLTSSGSTIAITAGLPAAETKAGYQALTFTPIGGVESIPAFGALAAVNTFQPLNGVAQKSKGPVNAGSIALPYAYDKADAGQMILSAAADPTNNAQYSICVTFSNGDQRYARVRVFGTPETVGSATNTLMGNATIEVISAVVKANA